MLIGGLLLAVIGLTGIIGRIMIFFTPPIIGSVLILLCLQLSGNFVGGIIEASTGVNGFQYAPLVISIIVIGTVVMVAVKAPPLLRSINVLFGLGVGWILYALFVEAPAEAIEAGRVFALPQLFAWGFPTFDPGTVITGALITVVILTNLLASTAAMSKAASKPLQANDYNRAVIFNGAANLLAGIGASVGTVPFAASTGLVKMSGVSSRKPFIVFCLMIMGTGFFPQAGTFIARIPQPVGYAVLLAAFTQILIVGLQQLKKLDLDQRDSFVIGLTVLIGAGVASLPEAALVELPGLARYIFGNALIMGVIICILLEHVFLRRR